MDKALAEDKKKEAKAAAASGGGEEDEEGGETKTKEVCTLNKVSRLC